MKTLSLLSVFIFLSCHLVFGQDEITTDLPILSPQSPTVHNLGQYGEVSLNESTGTISPSIPLTVYNAGNFSIPLTLQYSGNGVRVAQEPTWVGINWNINPGGVITREVRDRIDEKTTRANKKYYSKQMLDDLEGARKLRAGISQIYLYDPTTEWYNTLFTIANSSVIDSEVDIFNYNFLGYSGSFYLDEDLKAHLVKYDKEIDITFNYLGENKSYIVIKTPNGDTFFFGGPDASESSRSLVNSGPAYNVGIEFAQNAFHLYLVSPAKGGAINFTYENKKPTSSDYRYSLGLHEEAIHTSTNGQSNYNENTRILFNEVESSVYLTKISSTLNNQYIEFYSTLMSSSSQRRKLSKISLKNEAGIDLMAYKMDYLTPETESSPLENRFFLEKVDFTGKFGTTSYSYKLEYDNPEGLPTKASFARDHDGYFNNKTSNTTLLPQTGYTNYGGYNSANREPDFISAKKGSLKKIIYPTKGSSTFEYEAGSYKIKDVYETVFLNTYANDPTRNGETKLQDVYWYQQDLGYTPVVNHNIEVVVSATTEGSIIKSSVEFILESTSGVVLQSQSISLENTESGIKNYGPITMVFPVVTSETYIFKLRINRHETALNNYITAHATTSFIEKKTLKEDGAGLRIKRIINKEFDGSSPKITRYYYNVKESINEEIAFLHTEPSYEYITQSYTSTGDFIGGYLISQQNHLTANSVNNTYGNDIGQKLYPYITLSYGGDYFENGGKELVFSVRKNIPPTPYFLGSGATDESNAGYGIKTALGSNHSYANSTLLKESLFEYKNEEFIMKKETINKYAQSFARTQHNIKIFPWMSPTSFLINYRIGLYETYSVKYNLISTEVKDYYDNPLIPLITKTDYEYTFLSGLPSSITVKDSQGVLQKNKIYYPSDADDLVAVSGADKSIIKKLHENHRVAEPVRTEKYVDGSLLSTTQVLYSDEWETIELPKKIQTSYRNDPLEDRVVFQDYNSYGSPKILSKNDDSKTYYEYNILQQVIRKIENYQPSNSFDNDYLPCHYQGQYPNSLVTEYNYNPDTKQLISVVDPNCFTTYYEYDAFNRLKSIKDKDGNIVKNFDYHYRNE